MYGTWCFKLFLPFVGGKKKAKRGHTNVSWYILMYAWYILMNSVFSRSVGSRVFSRTGVHQEVAHLNSPGRQEQKDVTHAAYVFQGDQWNSEERLSFCVCCFWHLVCKRLQFIVGRMLLAINFYLLNIFSSFRNQYFAEKRLGLLLWSLLVKSENYDLLEYFQDIVICNEIWHALKVSQDMEYIFCIFQRVLIFFPGWSWLKKGFFFSTPAVGDIVCRACSI